MPPDPALIALAKQFAVTNNLYPELVCAVIEQESAWDTWAYRYEPEFYQHYITPLLDRGEVKTRTEATMRATSWGLMQIMGQVAREYGFQGPFLSALCVPETGIRIGCGVAQVTTMGLGASVSFATVMS